MLQKDSASSICEALFQISLFQGEWKSKLFTSINHCDPLIGGKAITIGRTIFLSEHKAFLFDLV
jgi:hypothetical protein